MTQVIVVVEDKLISVDGEAITIDYNYPTGLWALRWNGVEGEAEWQDCVIQHLTLADVQPYIDAHAEVSTQQYEARKQAELNEDPASLARKYRNEYLELTDWWVLPDRTPTPEQLTYREALRELPDSWAPAWHWDDTSNERSEHHAELVGVIWPTKPEGGN